jgi:uncharacterized damage-inducible protein DinB
MERQMESRIEFRDIFLKQKEAIRKRSLEVFALIKPEHLPFKPEPGALALGEMLQHMWRSEEGVRKVALDDNFDYYEVRVPQGLFPTLGPLQTLEENLRNLARVHAETLAAVAASPASRFEEERVNDHLKFRRKVYTILLAINEHEIHHRAQLMTYLRILGTPVSEAARR